MDHFCSDTGTVQAPAFIPANPDLLQGSFATPPSDMSPVEHGSPYLPPDEMRIVLERAHQKHMITTHMLQVEQEMVRKLQAELDDSKRLASTLVASHRLNAEILKVAIHRIEPNVDKMVKQMDSLNGPRGVAYRDAVDLDIDHERLLGETVHGPKAPSYLHEGSPQLSAPPATTDQRPSILYDVLGQHGQHGVDDHKIPDTSRSLQEEDTEQEPIIQGTLRQSQEADHDEQGTMHMLVEQASHQRRQEVDTLSGPDRRETGAPAVGEFHSLDEAFESDFFSKPVNGLAVNRRLKKRHSSDGTLIDIDVFGEKSGSPRSKVVNGDSSETGTSEHRQPHNTTAVKPSDVQTTESTIAEPALSVKAVS